MIKFLVSWVSTIQKKNNVVLDNLNDTGIYLNTNKSEVKENSQTIQNALAESQFPLIDMFFNKTKRKDMQRLKEIMKDLLQANFPFEEIGKNFPSLFKFIWYSKGLFPYYIIIFWGVLPPLMVK